MPISPLGKREFPEDVECDISLQTSQLGIYSPPPGHHFDNGYKRPRFDHSLLNNNRVLDNLCNLSYSALANIDLESYFNENTFSILSQEKRSELTQMLPDIDINYPSPLGSQQDFYEVAPPISPCLFKKNESPVFWEELADWQNSLSQEEYTEQDLEPNRVDKFKDEAFETYWGELNDKEKAHNVAGESKNITLKDMCRKGLIREKDIIQYKRNFSACKVVVLKTMEVVKASGATGISIKLDDEIFEDFETPTALETKILDHHGQVTKDKRPNGNAFKSIHLIRSGKDMGRLFDIRKDGFGNSN
ncbi:hypothetical protein K501DRAFT_287978 [Backusella circina FSU 941]|nr:hypothetical protein K501DRAFT_287978 [Backusella circina FSU 941]